eukprot:1158144-Pelagomonas_calceolata.AAC.7
MLGMSQCALRKDSTVSADMNSEQRRTHCVWDNQEWITAPSSLQSKLHAWMINSVTTGACTVYFAQCRNPAVPSLVCSQSYMHSLSAVPQPAPHCNHAAYAYS